MLPKGRNFRRLFFAPIAALVAILALLAIPREPSTAAVELEYSASKPIPESDLREMLTRISTDPSLIAEVYDLARPSSGWFRDAERDIAQLASNLQHEIDLSKSRLTLRHSHPDPKVAAITVNAAAYVLARNSQQREEDESRVRKSFIIQEDKVQDREKFLRLIVQRETEDREGIVQPPSAGCPIGPLPKSQEVSQMLEIESKEMEDLRQQLGSHPPYLTFRRLGDTSVTKK